MFGTEIIKGIGKSMSTSPLTNMQGLGDAGAMGSMGTGIKGLMDQGIGGLMDRVSISPEAMEEGDQEEKNPAGPAFQMDTQNLIGEQTKQGNIDDFESGKIKEVMSAIQNKISQDQSQGIDPQQDQELAAMQSELRKMVEGFSQYNPSQSAEKTEGK